MHVTRKGSGRCTPVTGRFKTTPTEALQKKKKPKLFYSIIPFNMCLLFL